jgi:hypothetical protein
MKYIYCLLFVFLVFDLSAQDILFEKETNELYEVSKYGANRKHFLHLYTGFGLYSTGSTSLKPYHTHDFTLGLRYKRKINSFFSAGSALYWKRSNFRYKNDPEIIDQGTFLDKEKLNVNSAGTEVYVRINFDTARGNYVGNFIDFGGYGEWHFSDAYKTYKEGGFALFKKKKTIYRQLDQMKNFGYGVQLRMARNRFVVFIRYRISDYLKNGEAEPPKAVIGLEISLHK